MTERRDKTFNADMPHDSVPSIREYPAVGSVFYWLSKFTVYCFLKLFFSVQLEGAQAVPPAGPFILAANHPSYFDPPLLATVVRRRVCFLAKEELFRNRAARFYLRAIRAIPVKRGTSDLKAMRLALAVLRKEPLLVFPQGLRGAPLDQVHAGVGLLAKRSGVPVIAARIYGAEKIMAQGRLFSGERKIRVVFARVDTIARQDTKDVIASKVMERIKSL